MCIRDSQNNDFQLVIDGDLTIGGVITFHAFAYVGIFTGPDPGVVIDIAVSLDIDSVLNLLDINLAGRLQINTTHTARSQYMGANFGSNGQITGFALKNFVDFQGLSLIHISEPTRLLSISY